MLLGIIGWFFVILNSNGLLETFFLFWFHGYASFRVTVTQVLCIRVL